MHEEFIPECAVCLMGTQEEHRIPGLYKILISHVKRGHFVIENRNGCACCAVYQYS